MSTLTTDESSVAPWRERERETGLEFNRLRKPRCRLPSPSCEFKLLRFCGIVNHFNLCCEIQQPWYCLFAQDLSFYELVTLFAGFQVASFLKM